jgi:hypothetical protein
VDCKEELVISCSKVCIIHFWGVISCSKVCIKHFWGINHFKITSEYVNHKNCKISIKTYGEIFGDILLYETNISGISRASAVLVNFVFITVGFVG